MTGTSTQPSRVATEDTPPDRPKNVVTSDNPPPAADDDPNAAPPDEAGQTTDESATSDPKKSKPTRNRGAEHKIARLTKKLARERDARQQDRQRIADLERQIDALGKSSPAAEPKPEPQLKDFKTPQEYAKAFNEWHAAKQSRESQPAAERRPSTDTSTQGPSAEELEEFRTKGTEKLGDEFVEAMQNPSDVAVNRAMGDFILDSDVGPELYTYLYNHPEEARRIYNKSETVVGRRMTELEERITKAGTWDLDDDDDQEQDGEARKKAGSKKRTTRAPEPPEDPRPTDTKVVDNLEEADMDSYAETRRKQLQNRRSPLL